MKTRPCQARDKATCPTHGTKYIANSVHQYTQERGFSHFSPEEAEILTEDIIEIIGYVGKPDSGIIDDRDEAGIYDVWKSIHHADYIRLEAPIIQIIHKISFLQDKNKTTLPENNLLQSDAREVHGNYNVSLGTMVAEEGTPVAADAGNYSWEDYEMKAHVQKCGVAAISNPRSDSWVEFHGTFEDDDFYTDGHAYGASADVQCKCGNFKGKMRLEGNLTELTRNLVNKYT